MKFFSFCGIVFYTTVICLLGLFFIAFALQLNIVLPETIYNFLATIYNDLSYRYIMVFVGILLILVSLSFAQVILGKFERERTIAFKNPSGPVIISLSAIEDLIKRLTFNIIEIKETRPYVIKRKKELEVYLRIALGQETNIPDLTNHLQELVKNKIQDVLRIEDPITVKVHVYKIISIQEKKKKNKEATTEEAPVPFQGYMRT